MSSGSTGERLDPPRAASCSSARPPTIKVTVTPPVVRLSLPLMRIRLGRRIHSISGIAEARLAVLWLAVRAADLYSLMGSLLPHPWVFHPGMLLSPAQ